MTRECKRCGHEFAWHRNGLRGYCCELCRDIARRQQKREVYYRSSQKRVFLRKTTGSTYLDIVIKNAIRTGDGTNIRKIISLYGFDVKGVVVDYVCRCTKCGEEFEKTFVFGMKPHILKCPFCFKEAVIVRRKSEA